MEVGRIFMMDMVDLAIQYGGFTNLDRVYLQGVLSRLTTEEQLTFITPPPSVINAYFAELYQKQSPEAATDYFFNLSKALQLFQTNPSFQEEKPFVRLNLSGKAFGFAYQDETGLAQVFAEEKEEMTAERLFEIAQIFPHDVVFEKAGRIFMKEWKEPADWQTVILEEFLLTDIAENTDWVKVSSLNQEEACQASTHYSGEIYYAWSGRTAIIYVKK